MTIDKSGSNKSALKSSTVIKDINMENGNSIIGQVIVNKRSPAYTINIATDTNINEIKLLYISWRLQRFS